MNLTRLSHLIALKRLGNSRQHWLNTLQILPYTVFRKECISTKLAVVDQAVLDRVEDGWRQVISNIKHCGNAIFVLGPMSDGKTTTIENCFKTHEHYRQYAYVDTDEIMGSIDAFTADKVDLYYPLARKIAIKLTDWILAEKISFVAEGTCVKYNELIEYMERLKDGGYKIHVNRLQTVPLDVILRRSKHRKNRIISDDVVESIYKDANLGLKRLYKHNELVNCSLFEDIDRTVTDINLDNKHNHVKPLCA